MSTMGGGCTIWCGGEIGCKRCHLFVSAQGHELTRQWRDVDEAWHWIVLSLDDELGDAGEYERGGLEGLSLDKPEVET